MEQEQKRKTPARIRYEQSHPVVSFRIKREYYDRLQDLLEKSNKTIGDFFREALEVQEKGNEDIYEQASKVWRIWYYCDVCGKEVNIKPNSNAHKEIFDYSKTKGWGHKECRESKGIEQKKIDELEQKNRAEEFIKALSSDRSSLLSPEFLHRIAEEITRNSKRN